MITVPALPIAKLLREIIHFGKEERASDSRADNLVSWRQIISAFGIKSANVLCIRLRRATLATEVE
jgi:hypothetical protein